MRMSSKTTPFCLQLFSFVFLSNSLLVSLKNLGLESSTLPLSHCAFCIDMIVLMTILFNDVAAF